MRKNIESMFGSSISPEAGAERKKKNDSQQEVMRKRLEELRQDPIKNKELIERMEAMINPPEGKEAFRTMK